MLNLKRTVNQRQLSIKLNVLDNGVSRGQSNNWCQTGRHGQTDTDRRFWGDKWISTAKRDYNLQNTKLCLLHNALFQLLFYFQKRKKRCEYRFYYTV